MLITIAQAFAVFASMFFVDIFWTLYIVAIEKRRRHLAAFYSVAIMATGAFTTISYIGNWWMIVPILAGAYAGTYTAVRLSREKIPMFDETDIGAA
jgi:hypothetical protein